MFKVHKCIAIDLFSCNNDIIDESMNEAVKLESHRDIFINNLPK